MKKGIHPQLFLDAEVTDLSTGDKFTLASTKKEISVEVSNLSHPFYTGKHKIVDTENLVKKFEAKKQAANKDIVAKKRAKIKQRNSKLTSLKGSESLTLKDMLSKYA